MRFERPRLFSGVPLGALCVLFTGLFTSTTAVAAEASAKNEPLSVSYERWTLDNGLEVLFHKDSRTPFVAASVWYHVGAIDEPQGKTGFAHLFEHLMFQGTPNVGDDNHIRYLEEAGASIRNGMVNGTTNFDRTNYFEVVPRNELGLALWLEADRMGYLIEGMTQAKLDEQRKVVKNERRQSVENQPYGLVEEKLWQSMFPVEHPYYGMVIGSMVDLDAATLEDVGGFYDDYYAPSNATLVVAGDAEASEVKMMVAKYFATLPKWKKPTPRTIPAPTLAAPIRMEVKESVGRLPKILMSFFSPALFAPGDAELDVLTSVLTGSKSARLYRKLVLEEQSVQFVSAHQQSMGNVSVFGIEAVVNPGHDPAKVIETIRSVLADLQKNPPTDVEVRRSVNASETAVLFGLQKIGGFSGKAEKLQSYNHYLKKPDSLEADIQRYRDVTPQQVSDVIGKFLMPKQSAIAIAIPLTDAEREAKAKETPAKESPAKAEAAPKGAQ